MNNTFLDLYNEFLDCVSKGDEALARKFLVDNIKRFPQEAQDSIIFAFFEEALDKETKDMGAITKIQKEGLDALAQIDKVQKILEDQIKVKDLKAKITQQPSN
ncbi:MAG: hypothetical protein WCI76_00825 [bacterium]